MQRFYSPGLIAILFILATSTAAIAAPATVSDDCPCKRSIERMITAYDTDERFKELVDAAFANMQQTPPDYSIRNPWIGKSFPDLISFMEEWCTFLPEIHGSSDNGLKYIQKMAMFYYDNPFGVAFVQLTPGRGFLEQFVRERGAYMDSPESTKIIAQWLADPRI